MAEFSKEPGEHVVMSVRKHVLIFVAQLLPYAVLAYLPILIPDVLTTLPLTADMSQILERWQAVLTLEDPWARFIVGIYWLFLWMGAFGAFTRYYLDEWIVTNHRVVKIEQVGFWNREVSSLHMNRVQDVMTDVEGILPTLFGFGTISIETAGEDSNRFRMKGVQNARHLRDLIMKEVTQRQARLATHPKDALF